MPDHQDPHDEPPAEDAVAARTADEHADHALLARLADGSLPARERDAALRRVAASSQLSELLDEQRRALRLVTETGVLAPAGLRDRIEAQQRRRAPRLRWAPRRRAHRLTLAGALAGALATAVLAIALVVPSGTPGAPAVVQAAALTVLPSQQSAPAQAPGSSRLERADGAGIPYPYWGDAFGWQARGLRTDVVSGHHATTVFYVRGRLRIGYTIVSAPALTIPRGLSTTSRDATTFWIERVGNRPVVIWLRAGRTCILSGTGVSVDLLSRLASWHAG